MTRRVPIFRALTRPTLLMHCDRECLLVGGGACLFVFFRFGLLAVDVVVMMASALAFGAVVGVLLWATKKDPQWRAVLVQAARYQPPWRRVTRLSRTARWDCGG